MKKCLFSLIKFLSLRCQGFLWSIYSPGRPSHSHLHFNYLITFMREEFVSSFISDWKEKRVFYVSVSTVYICSLKESSQGQISSSVSTCIKRCPQTYRQQFLNNYDKPRIVNPGTRNILKPTQVRKLSPFICSTC